MSSTAPDENQEELFEPGHELGEDAPLVYVATPLSQLSDREDRSHAQLLAHTVTRAIQDQARGAQDPWHIGIHSPIKMSAPWNEDDWSDEDIYRLNSEKLLAGADAMIMIHFRGGSLGMGQEQVWAASRAIPALCLHPEETVVSRQLRGARNEHDLEVVEYGSPESIGDIVGKWLVARRALISDGPRRRRNLALRYAGRRNALVEAWCTLPPAVQAHVIAVTRLARGRIERILSSPLLLASAPASEVSDLAGALGIEANGELFSRPLPDLDTQQLEALSNAAAEFEWSFETALDLRQKARVELVRGGIRRFPLGSVPGWADFYEHHYGH